MPSVGSADRGCCGIHKRGGPWKIRTLGGRASSFQPSLTKILRSRSYLFCVYLVVHITTTCYRPVSAQANFSFSSQSTWYNCSTTVTCLGAAHMTNAGASEFSELSLLQDNLQHYLDGVVYYKEAVRFLDTASRQSTSFKTNFKITTIQTVYIPDGFAFVISADNQGYGSDGGYGACLGIFNQDISFNSSDPQYTTNNGQSTFKSIVIEFDSFQNPEAPVYDISDNHVSIDFGNLTFSAAKNASDVNITLGGNLTLYAWVEYGSQTQQLEVRLSDNNTRPISPLLNYTVDLFDVTEEYMWVGFSAADGGSSSNFLVGEWSFESYGIPSVALSGARSKWALILGTSAGGLVLFLACGYTVLLLYRTRSVEKGSFTANGIFGWTKFMEEDTMVQVKGMPENFSYQQLRVATRNFNTESKLGEGGFGTVHRGVLPCGRPIAVKKINGKSAQGESEFMAEVSIISQVKHRNLIQLLGWCKVRSRAKYLLVYELMPNGSLDKVSFGAAGQEAAFLSWPQRFNIVRGIAAALHYLHQDWTQQVIHRDIKSSNIMLDEKWNAKLGDFGLARLVDHERTAATTMVTGTYGYIAPEVPVSGKFTDKTDVYAFGAVVLEVAWGRKALDPSLPEEEMLVVDWVWQKLSEGDLMSTVDKRLDNYDRCQVEMMLKIGLLCSHPNPLARPSMKDVVMILAGDASLPPIPASKPTLMFSSDREVAVIEGFGSEITRSTFRSMSKWLVSMHSSD